MKYTNIKVGDIVMLTEEGVKNQGEVHVFQRIPYTVNEVTDDCVSQLDNWPCCLSFTRFEIIEDYEIY